MSEKKIIQSVERAILILELFSNRDSELALSEISHRLSLNKSTAFGILSTLEHYNFVQKASDTGKYKLGIKLLELGNMVLEQMDLRQIARPYLDELVAKFSETSHLAVLDGYEVVYIDKVDSDRSIRMNSEVGSRRPGYCTGVGKAILSYLPDDQWKKHLPPSLEKFTPNTIISQESLLEEMKHIRQKGFSEDNEEIEEGLSCVGVPIFNQGNQVIASISVSGPTARLPKEKMMQIAEELKDVSAEISRKMGYLPKK
ncbi:transcriptional regulator KdgR [Peptococcaceae bacterium CEB3]|nr:transcriptional regulator KdgR [Peptococcaceae bacterium CEB3]